MSIRFNACLVAVIILAPNIDAGEKTSSVVIHPPCEGVVERIHVRLGDKVKKGDLLVVVDAPALKEKYALARANQQVAEAKFQRAENDAQRAEKLRRSGAISENEYADFQIKRVEAKAGLEVARAQLQRMESLVERLRVYAPIEGRVAQIATVGAFVKETDVVARVEGFSATAEWAAIKALQKERHELLTKVANEALDRAKAGKFSLSEIAAANRAVLEAGLELCATPAERLALYRKHLEFSEFVARMAEDRKKGGVGSETDALSARAFVLEARIRLLREEAKLKAGQ